MKFLEIIEKYMEKQGIESNVAMAKKLGISRQGLIQIKNGEGGLKDSTVQKLMNGTGLEAWEIEAAWKAEHGRTEEIRRSWQRFLKKSAVAGVLVAVAYTPNEAYANINAISELPVYYVKSCAWLLFDAFILARFLELSTTPLL